MKKKSKISKNLIKNCIGLIIIVSLILSILSALNARYPDEFKNLPEGEIIDETLYENMGKDWIPTGTPNRRAKESDEIFLYDNDPNAIFFAKQPKLDDRTATAFYHKKSDVLPKPYDEGAIVVLSPSNGPNITLKDELANEFKSFIEKCGASSENAINVNERKRFVSVDIYHKDYPAYHRYATIFISSKKLMLNTFETSYHYSYYELPDNLSEQIKQLME